MRVAVASDHAGVELQEPTVAAIRSAGHEPVVVAEPVDGDDYPDVALAVGDAIRSGRAERGVVLCGSGAGVTVAANKIPLVRAALAYDTYTARQMVEHDAVNVLALGARVIGDAIATDVVEAFVGARFSGAERHVRRLGKVIDIEATRVGGLPAVLRAHDQRLWLRGVRAADVDDGRVAGWIGDHGVTGVLASADVLRGAVADDPRYAERVADHRADGVADVADLALQVVLDDVVAVADLLRATFLASGGRDGYAVVDLPPTVVDDVDATVETARWVRTVADRPNVMVGVPATRAGLGALTALASGGVPVAATALYSREQYGAVVDAYLAAVERLLDDGLAPTVGVAAAVSVAPWDDATADRLPAALRNEVGRAVARSIQQRHRELLDSERWRAFAEVGALPPRLLFVDLTPDDPLPATWYLDGIDAEATTVAIDADVFEAMLTGPEPTDTVDDAGSAATLERVADAGVTVDVLATRLRHEGLRRDAAAWSALVEAVDRRLGELPPPPVRVESG